MNNNLDPQYIIFSIITILIALVIHEYMHAYAGHWLGDTTAKDQGRLSLNPWQHIDPFMTLALPIITLVVFGVPFLAAKPVPFNPERLKYDEFGAAIVAAAGPFANLALAFVGVLLVKGLLPVGALGSFLSIFVFLNIALFVFNLLPIPPLDGSRVLYAFAPEPVQRFMEQIEPLGFFIIFGLVLFGGLSSVLMDLNQAVLNFLT
jgi:Zn-dependent protease